MKRMIAKPQLGFSEAVKLAFGKITQMSGRSRRSEFWWFMLVYVIGYWVLSTIAAFVLPVVEAQIAVGLIMLVALPATARRLHDTGHGSWWVIVSWALNIGLSIYMITSSCNILIIANKMRCTALKANTKPYLVIFYFTYHLFSQIVDHVFNIN